MKKDKKYYLVIDQGTSSTKIFLFDDNNQICFSAREKHRLFIPAEYHVESDPLSILQSGSELIYEAVNYSENNNGIIVSAGMAVQRSTFLFWDKQTLKPLTPAISWQDSRSSPEADAFKFKSAFIHEKTGTPLSPHFGAPKYLNLVSNNSELKRRAESGEVWFGPLSAFLSHSFTGVAGIDESIAGRSLLMDLKSANWSQELCDLFDINIDTLPLLKTTCDDYGIITMNNTEIPLKVVIGDQQAALVGQAGNHPGALAMNFGTSGSIQHNIGNEPLVISGLISSVLTSSADNRYYLLEGTINACNALFYYLEDKLEIPHREMKWHDRCKRTKTDGIYVPGFMGIASPYWKDELDCIYYDTAPYKNDQVIRAAMESIGFLVYDIIKSIGNVKPINYDLITASGGGGRSPLLQFISDLIKINIGHSKITDRTAYGVYRLLLPQVLNNLPETGCDHIYNPQMPDSVRKNKITKWHHSLKKAGVISKN